ncbi:MAG: flagellar basal body rod protein FlgB [Gammaproteobacteria bacterium]|nr:flagellar basal body rod protein FlgB [Gammaproteobacteria bacterium]
MPINFDKALGVHDNALLLFERRNQLLAENITNADTPNYKARDIDFDSVLRGQQSGQLAMTATRKGHISSSTNTIDQHIDYRVPTQSSADGNSVDVQQEKAAFAENAVRYQTTVAILSRRFSGLTNAFKGE